MVDSQEVPLEGASIKIRVQDSQGAFIDEDGEETKSQADGAFLLALPSEIVAQAVEGRGELTLEVSKASYATLSRTLDLEGMARIGEQLYLPLGDLILEHRMGAAFFIATFAFLLVFGFISFRVLHETIAALMGAVAILGVSYLLGSSNPDFWIISFERAIHYIDFNVIFLIMGMMIFMAIMAQTGVFAWVAFQAYRLARGNAWYLAVILIMVTGVISAFLNDVTAILLMAPVSIEIALVLGIHPFSLVIPEVLASNIGGASTLIGDPPSTIIGSYVGIGFNEFLFNMGPVGVSMMIVLVPMIWFIYNREYRKAHAKVSPTLLRRLEEDSRITDPRLLKKSIVVALFTLVLFFIEDFFGMPPSVAALVGATTLLVWVRPDVHEMLQEVDWTTLVFFMSLFMLVGGLQEVGVIQTVAGAIKEFAGDNLTLAVVLIIWISAIASGIVANIPFTVAVLPIAVLLTETIAGPGNKILYWALVVGVDFGGNATYLGSAPNIVAAGILDRAGYHLSFGRFLRVGVPVTFVTLLLSTIWILIRY